MTPNLLAARPLEHGEEGLQPLLGCCIGISETDQTDSYNRVVWAGLRVPIHIPGADLKACLPPVLSQALSQWNAALPLGEPDRVHPPTVLGLRVLNQALHGLLTCCEVP